MKETKIEEWNIFYYLKKKLKKKNVYPFQGKDG
jgi:hypothetical protein